MDEVVVAKSLMKPDVYYIFRNDSDEVEVKVEGGYLRPSKKLTAKEANYFRTNFLNKK